MTFQIAAQIAANAEPDVGRALHIISLMQGRLYELQAALAGQDARKRASTMAELDALLDQLRATSPREQAA